MNCAWVVILCWVCFVNYGILVEAKLRRHGYTGFVRIAFLLQELSFCLDSGLLVFKYE